MKTMNKHFLLATFSVLCCFSVNASELESNSTGYTLNDFFDLIIVGPTNTHTCPGNKPECLREN